MRPFTRRDFLKLSALIPASIAISPWISNLISPKSISQDGLPNNILVILFDAMTARNMSVYGYPRDTTPNLNRFASRANVYHSHYSAANFTIPGTASLLSGLYPWTHRAISQAGLMARELTGRNIFKLMGDRYKRLAFAQNVWASYIVDQFYEDIDIHLSPQSFSLANGMVGNWFKNDLSAGYHSFDDFLFKFDKVNPNELSASLLFGTIQRLNFLRQVAQSKDAYSQEYPVGLPNTDNYPIYFRLEDVISGLITDVKNIKTPTFGYFHLYPPHEPYNPSKEFFLMFRDHYQSLPKPEHPLSQGISQTDLIAHRRRYDQYVANIDFEFGRLLDALEQSGLLDKSVVVVTADHGQLFERGEHGHFTPLMYDPVLRVPLLISTPGQSTRNDIHDPTNSVDVLPTLAHLANQPVPEWREGTLLPGLGGQYDPQRSTFSVEAKQNPAFAPLKIGTIAMRKGPYKLIHYMGYEKGFSDTYELYNLDNDPEEMTDLYQSEPVLAAQLKDELLSKLNESNSHYHG